MTDRPTLTPEQVGAAAEIVAIRVHGYRNTDDAPTPLRAYAAALKAGAAQCAVAVPQLCSAPRDSLLAALASLARAGLIPGTAADKTATAYLFWQGGPSGRPSPLGRIAMAAAAGWQVSTAAVGKADEVSLNDDGEIERIVRKPDARPTSWDTVRGVEVDCITHHGERRRLWVSAGEIGVRRDKSSGKGSSGGWATDAVGMACTKAVSILVDRRQIPQAPIPIPGLREWQAAKAGALPTPAPQLAAPPTRALPAPAEPTVGTPATPATDAPPAAPQPPEAAPADAPAPTPADDAPPAQDAPSAPQGGGTEAQVAPAAPTWDDVGEVVMAAVRAARPDRAGDGDDLHAAAAGAIREAQAGAAAKGKALTPAAALDPKALDRLTAMAVARLRAM